MSHSPIIACSYCGRQYHNVALQRAPAPPPPVPLPRPAKGHSIQMVLALGVSAMTAVGVGIFAYSTVRASSAPRAGALARSSPTAPSPAALVAWESRQLTFFKGTGAVPNLVGVASFGDGATALVGLEGSSGKLLWRAPSGMCDLYTDEGERIVRFETGKTLSRYDARTGKPTWTLRLTDNIRGVAFGSGCLNVRMSMSQALVGIDTEFGQTTSCTASGEPAFPLRLSEPVDVSTKRGDVTLTGRIRSDDRPVNPEPARLAVVAQRGSTKLWEAAPASIEPVWETGGFDRSLAFLPPGAFLFGRASSDHTGRYALVDVTSGRIVYEKQAPEKVDSRVHVGGGGDVAFVTHDGQLYAYDTSSGALRWSIQR